MKRLATMLAGLLLLSPLATRAQDGEVVDVTVREINTIPEENINELKQLGAALTAEDIERLVRSPYAGQTVRITAVVLAEPRNSGLASVVEGIPNRVHFFVRDVAAETEGKAGMDLQVVDGHPGWVNHGVIGLFKGDVVEIIGEVAYFGTVIQLTPETVNVIGNLESEGISESILDPVEVTTADLNMSMGEGKIQANWDNFNDLNQQYVRIVDATVWRSPNRTDARPNWAVTTDGATTFIQNDDISLCFRNDQSDYPDDFNQECIENTFEAPLPGARVNVTGFALLRSDFDPLGIGAPPAGVLKIAPWEADDLEVTAEPLITGVAFEPLDGVPGDAPIDITVTVEGDLETITGVELTYETSASDDPTTVTMTEAGAGTYTAEIPAQDDGTFVTYTVGVTDTEGTTYTTPSPGTTRVLFDGIDAIADIQTTADGGSGDSPFAGATVPVNITATVQSDPATSGFIAIQDDAELAPWSGILLSASEALLADLARGDVITITEATISENFDVTELSEITYTKGDSGDPLGYKTLTTDAMQDAGIAEAHEGMLVRFEDVTIINPDAGFGEWTFSSDGTEEHAVKADDASSALSENFAVDNLEAEEERAFMQGIWWFSFSEYKLIPESAADTGDTGTATEDETVPGTFALAQNYPNPFNPATAIDFTLPQAGNVRLAVYDVLGREVAVLQDGPLAAGTHTVRFDAAHLASGLYLYRLTGADGTTLTRTMLLLK